MSPKIESQTVKSKTNIKNKSTKEWLTIIEIKLPKINKDKYKTSIKKRPSIKESEEAMPNQLLKKIKIEKYKIITIFWLIYKEKKLSNILFIF